MSLGWQFCIAKALEGQGAVIDDIPPSAKLSYRPIPNMQFTLFVVCWKEPTDDSGLELPQLAGGETHYLDEFMEPTAQRVAH